MSAVTVAVARHTVGAPADFDAFALRQREALLRARARGAQVAVLPEYLSLELAACFDPPIRGDLLASLAAIQRHRGDWIDLFAGLARETGMLVAAGSFLLDAGRGVYRNRCDVFAPAGTHRWQDKLQLTGFERSVGCIAPGDALEVFEWDALRLGVSICYDIEFPLPVRAQCEAGARLLLVPSCTDTAAGAARVRIGCLARALENRCFVAQAVTAGEAPWSPALDCNTGEAGVYAPMDVGLPDDGILAQTRAGEEWALSTPDFGALDASRARAQVANDRDWPAQGLPSIARAQVRVL